MNDIELKRFIETSNKESIKDYLDSLKSKIETLDTKNERVGLLLLLICISYFLIKESLISNVNLGIVEVATPDIGLIAIPPVFSFLLFFYAVLASHKSKVTNTCKVLSHYYYIGELKKIEDVISEVSVTSMYLPFSVFGEINKVNTSNERLGCLAALAALPILGLILFPFWFLYHSISYLYLEYWEKSSFVKPAFFLSCWLTLATMIFFTKLLTPKVEALIGKNSD